MTGQEAIERPDDEVEGAGEAAASGGDSRASGGAVPATPDHAGENFRGDVPLGWGVLGWGVVALGVVFCLRQYLAGRTLFMDEAKLMAQVLKRSWGGLFEPLSGGQSAPVVFLWLVKASTALLGANVWGFRLVPLLAACLSLPLLWLWLRRIAPIQAALVGITVACFSAPMIQYAAMTKQYSFELLVSLVVLLAVVPVIRDGLSLGRGMVLGAVGAVAVWCSQPVIFVLGGCGVVLLAQAIAARSFRRIGGCVAIGSVWLASFAGVYLLILSAYAQNEGLDRYWSLFYLERPGRMMHRWTAQLSMVFDRPVGLSMSQIGMLLGLIGVGAVIAARGALGWCVVLGLVLTGAVSMLRVYPFGDRLMMFAVPLLLALLISGLACVWSLGGGRGRAIAVVITVVILANPIRGMGRVKPLDDVGPVLDQVLAAVEPGDVLLVGNGAAAVWHLDQATARRYDPGETEVIVGAYGSRGFEKAYDLYRRRLLGRPRVWLVASHLRGPGGQETADVFLSRLARLQGTLIRTVPGQGAVAYLLDLSVPVRDGAERPHAPGPG